MVFVITDNEFHIAGDGSVSNILVHQHYGGKHNRVHSRCMHRCSAGHHTTNLA